MFTTILDLGSVYIYLIREKKENLESEMKKRKKERKTL